MDRGPRPTLGDGGELTRAVLARDIGMERARRHREERAGEQAQRVDEPSGEKHATSAYTNPGRKPGVTRRWVPVIPGLAPGVSRARARGQSGSRPGSANPHIHSRAP